MWTWRDETKRNCHNKRLLICDAHHVPAIIRMFFADLMSVRHYNFVPKTNTKGVSAIDKLSLFMHFNLWHGSWSIPDNRSTVPFHFVSLFMSVQSQLLMCWLHCKPNRGETFKVIRIDCQTQIPIHRATHFAK